MSPGERIVCEFFDLHQCGEGNSAGCNSTETCDVPDAGKRVHCYALWRNESGVEFEKKVQDTEPLVSPCFRTLHPVVGQLHSKLHAVVLEVHWYPCFVPGYQAEDPSAQSTVSRDHPNERAVPRVRNTPRLSGLL